VVAAKVAALPSAGNGGRLLLEVRRVVLLCSDFWVYNVRFGYACLLACFAATNLVIPRIVAAWMYLLQLNQPLLPSKGAKGGAAAAADTAAAGGAGKPAAGALVMATVVAVHELELEMAVGKVGLMSVLFMLPGGAKSYWLAAHCHFSSLTTSAAACLAVLCSWRFGALALWLSEVRVCF
jgi:hypothetical protein